MNRILMALFICLLSVNCVGTDVGNPLRSADELFLEFSAFDETTSGALTLENGLEIDEAWIVFTRLNLRDADTCDGDVELDMWEPIVANLLDPESVFGNRGLIYEPGDYCRFILEFDPIAANDLPAGAPAELAEHSIFIRGRRADGTAFELRTDISDRFRLDSEGTSFRLEKNFEVLEVAFAANDWFDAAALDGVEAEEDLILIDDENNKALLTSFEDVLKGSARLFREGVLIARGEGG